MIGDHLGLSNSTGLGPSFEIKNGYNPGKSAGTSDPIDIVVSKKALFAGTLVPVKTGKAWIFSHFPGFF